jgi:serine/threonine protein kinase
MQHYRELLMQFGLENFNLHCDLEIQCMKHKCHSISYDYIEKCYNYTNNADVTHKYWYNRSITKGGYNDIKECSHEDKLIALRSPGEFTNRFDSFIENIKTIFLYCYAKAFIPVKIFPELYSFSYNKITKKYYLAMEYIPISFNKYIVNLHYCFINECIQKIFDIYTIFDHHSLRFRHGDLTTNNIMIQNGVPLLIDFGMSSFFLFDKYFDSADCCNYGKQGLNLLHDVIILYHSLSFSGINLIKIMPMPMSTERRFIRYLLRLPEPYFSGRTLHYFIRIFAGKLLDSKDGSVVGINKKLDRDILIKINDTLYFTKKESLNLLLPTAQKIFDLITKIK